MAGLDKNKAKRVKELRRNLSGADELVATDGTQVLNDANPDAHPRKNLDEWVGTGAIGTGLGETAMTMTTGGGKKLGGKLHNDGGAHEPMGNKVGERTKIKPEDGITKNVGENKLGGKLHNDGGAHEPAGGAGNMHAEWANPAAIAATIDEGVDLQSLFDSYARQADVITLEGFGELCHAYGHEVLDEATLSNLLANNREYMFQEGGDDHGRYWTKVMLEGVPPWLSGHKGDPKERPWRDDGGDEGDKPSDEDQDETQDKLHQEFGHLGAGKKGTVAAEGFNDMREFTPGSPAAASFDRGVVAAKPARPMNLVSAAEPAAGDDEIEGDYDAMDEYGQGAYQGCPECGSMMDELGCVNCGYVEDEALSTNLVPDLEAPAVTGQMDMEPDDLHWHTDPEYPEKDWERYDEAITRADLPVLESDGKAMDGPDGTGVAERPGGTGKKSGLPQEPTELKGMGKEWPRKLKNKGGEHEEFGNSPNGKHDADDDITDQVCDNDLGCDLNNDGGQWEPMEGVLSGGAKTMQENVRALATHIQRAVCEHASTIRTPGRYGAVFTVSCGDSVRPRTGLQLAEAAADVEELLQVFPAAAVRLEATYLDQNHRIVLERAIALPRVRARGPVMAETKTLFRFPEIARRYAQAVVAESHACRLARHNWGAAVSARLNYRDAATSFQRVVTEARAAG